MDKTSSHPLIELFGLESFDRDINAVKITIFIISVAVSQTSLDSCSCASFGQHQELGPLDLRVKSAKSDWWRVQNKFSAHAQKIGPGQRS